ncbi:MAG: hypothetical protein ABIF77_07725 [bacterium]
MYPLTEMKHRNSRTVKLAVLGLLVWVVTFWGAADQAQAQGGPSFSRVSEYIEMTHDILQRSREIVQETESVRARTIMEDAKQLHDRSYALLDSGKPTEAFNVSKRARSVAQYAVRVARDDSSFQERARVRLDRLPELYEPILERAQEVHHERALRFLNEAERQYHRAREQFAQHNYEISLNLLESAETLLRRAARLLFESGGAERLERDLERTQQFIDNTHERIGANGDPVALNLLVQAEDVLAQAHEALQAGQPLRTLHLAKQARRLAGEAAALISGSPSAESVQVQLERWDDRYSAVAEQVQESGNNEARLLLERAVRHRESAEDRLNNDDYSGALRQIKIAHDLLNEAGERIR